LSNYIELTVEVQPREQGSDVLIAQLSELGYESFVESSSGFLAYILQDTFDEGSVKAMFEEYSSVFQVHYFTKIIPQQNWNKEWESNFQPIDIEGKCFIHAPFHEPKNDYQFNIVIEPKMSFGTGHHDTTQLMISNLMNLDVSKKSLLDMGCGTGILAILASKLGANPILAIDIDEWSFQNTIENLEKNKITNVSTLQGDASLLHLRKFDIILANINKNILLRDLKFYCHSLESNGHLLISGFFITDAEELTLKATSLGLHFINSSISNDWAVLHFAL